MHKLFVEDVLPIVVMCIIAVSIVYGAIYGIQTVIERNHTCMKDSLIVSDAYGKMFVKCPNCSKTESLDAFYERTKVK